LKDEAAMQIGDILSFGSYKWRVLAIQNNTALIITDEIIEHRPYHDKYVDITWADCGLRKYLNGEFYDKFTDIDKSKIVPVKNKNPDNHWYGTKGGTDTQDSIFLLSLEEAVCKYFGDSSNNLLNPSKKQRYWFQRKDENNSKRCAGLKKHTPWYWIRSPGSNNKKAVYIHGDGNIGIQGNNIFKGNIDDFYYEGVKYMGGVRPAFWLKM
jgi:hypothetical protein